MQEDEEFEELNTGSIQLVEGSAGCTTGGEQQPVDAESSHVTGSPGSKIIRSPKRHSATGPRSLAGKQRSRRNALKSGLFAKIVLAKGESSAVYEALRKGLFKDRQPQGATETEVVKHIVATLWRMRRSLRTEPECFINGIIRQGRVQSMP
jgi:hypothetical protein